MSDQKIKVLIAEDSQVVLQLLSALFRETDDIQVIGHAKDGLEVVSLTKTLKPDIITMDIEMPGLNGFEATKKIMAESPTPIVVISSHVNTKALNTTFNALKAGALTVLEKPHDVLSEGFKQQKRSLLNTIRALSQVHVIKRHPAKRVEKFTVDKSHHYEVLALGASTGGPEALYFILSQMKKTFPVPIVVVQHICEGFLPGLVNWLQSKSDLIVEEVQQSKTPLLPGHVYLAPDHFHLMIQKGDRPMAILDDGPKVDHFKPSVTQLFESLAKSYPGQSVAGLLTGMGRDGADGLLSMKFNGCHTFIQNESSSIVYGMPGAAEALSAQEQILDLIDIPSFLTHAFQKGETYE